jgi:VanZ family protein
VGYSNIKKGVSMMAAGITDNLAFDSSSIGTGTTNHNPKKHRTIPIQYYLALVWLFLIYFISSHPSIADINSPFTHFDKLVHMGVYGILYLLLYWNLTYAPKSLWGRHPVFFSLLLTILYGLSDEIHQIYIPMRTADFADFLADSAGAGLAHLCLLFIRIFNRNLSLKNFKNPFSPSKPSLPPR